MITLLLTTDDVVKLRTAARRWNVGWIGGTGRHFLLIDEQGRRSYTVLKLRTGWI